MKSNQKLSLLVWLFKAKATKKDGKAPLYVRITIDGKDEEISLGRKVHPGAWDTELKKVTDGSPEGKAANKRIAEAKVDLERHFHVLQTQFEKITPLMLKNVFNGLKPNTKKTDAKIQEMPSMTLVTAINNYINRFQKMVDKGQRSNETLKHWKTTLNKVKAFIPFQYGTADIELGDMRYSFAHKMYDYLTLEVDDPLDEVTAKGHIKKVIQILTGCVKDETIPNNPLRGFKCSGGEKDVYPLEMTQVQKLYTKVLTISRLAEVRDAFIFQCFTGFAFQDIYALTKENVVLVGNSGERWLIKDRGKTGISEMVPILPAVEGLIQKYALHPACAKTGLLMPIKSNTKYNGYLKELADICGVERDLNTHLARHTFADMMLNNGVPLEDVSKMLGHKSIRTTQRYCKVRKERISENMGKVKEILFTQTGTLKLVV